MGMVAVLRVRDFEICTAISRQLVQLLVIE